MIDVLAFVILGIFVLSPLVAYVGTFRRQWGRGAYRILGVYYACLAVLTFAPMYVSIGTDEFLGDVLVIAQLLLVMSGPFVAMCVLAVARIGRVGVCHRCEYDLTGNMSGRCPECGEAVDEQAGAITFWQRIKGLAWRKFLVVYGVLCLLLCFVVCYTRVDGYWYCPECGMTKCETTYEFNLPPGFLTILEFDGPTRMHAYGHNPLVKYLDPGDSCKHEWMGMGYNAENLLYPVRASRYDVTRCTAAYETDFPAFLASHPGTLELIRADLRQRNSYWRWLDDQYDEWKEMREGKSSECEEDTAKSGE